MWLAGMGQAYAACRTTSTPTRVTALGPRRSARHDQELSGHRGSRFCRRASCSSPAVRRTCSVPGRIIRSGQASSASAASTESTGAATVNSGSGHQRRDLRSDGRRPDAWRRRDGLGGCESAAPRGVRSLARVGAGDPARRYEVPSNFRGVEENGHGVVRAMKADAGAECRQGGALFALVEAIGCCHAILTMRSAIMQTASIMPPISKQPARNMTRACRNMCNGSRSAACASCALSAMQVGDSLGAAIDAERAGACAGAATAIHRYPVAAPQQMSGGHGFVLSVASHDDVLW